LPRLRALIESRIGTVLGLFVLAGMLLPGLALVPGAALPWIIGIILLFACSRIEPADIARIRPSEVLGFYLLRFLLLPVPVYAALHFAWPRLAEAGLLTALMPAGATAPALAGILGGNPALALGLVALSSLAAPVAVPAVFSLVGGAHIQLDTGAMMLTLALTIFTPVLLYGLVLRRVPPLARAMKANASAAALLLIGFALAVVVAKRRDMILADPGFVLLAAAFQAGLSFCFYAAGWAMGSLPGEARRRAAISYAVSSGAVNIVLGISLALLFFPPETSLILVAGEIPWVLALPLFRAFLARRQG
jgi:BASS family bile acid:Na+ symporter